MTTEEIEASQSGVDEGGMGGPGAPTPLSALEVRIIGDPIAFKFLTCQYYRVLLVLPREIFN